VCAGLADAAGTNVHDVVIAKLCSGPSLIQGGWRRVGPWSRWRPRQRFWSPWPRVTRIARVVGQREGIDVCSLCVIPTECFAWGRKARFVSQQASFRRVCIGQALHGFGGFGSRPCRILWFVCRARHRVAVAFGPEPCSPAGRQRQRSRRPRWAIHEETCETYPVTLFALLLRFGRVVDPNHADAFPDQCTTVRTRLGLRPNVEGGD
jgi:hypothetical protein